MPLCWQDYDGCGRFSLTLNPTTEPIDSLQLRIPLRLSEAYLTHTVTDYIRENYAGSIPSGAIFQSGIARFL